MADWMEELERLGELRNKSYISDEEFEAERKLLLPSEKGLTDGKREQRSPSKLQTRKQSEIKSSLSVSISQSTNFDKFFLCVWTLLSAGSGPFLEALRREYPSEYEARISASEAFFGFGYPSGWPDDSIWCSALFLDVLFGGVIGFLIGLIVLKMLKWSIAKVNSLKSSLSENKIHEKVDRGK